MELTIHAPPTILTPIVGPIILKPDPPTKEAAQAYLDKCRAYRRALPKHMTALADVLESIDDRWSASDQRSALADYLKELGQHLRGNGMMSTGRFLCDRADLIRKDGEIK
jgi:hypothetical protein